MATDLAPYVPRLLPEIAGKNTHATHTVIDGTLVFADLSGFTALSERLASLGGKAGAEEMTAVLNEVFAELLDVAARQGGEMLKYGGDAVLLLFRTDDHPVRAAIAASEMQRSLRRVGNIWTELGRVRLRMSVGIHTGPIDFFVVGPHRELVVSGRVPTVTAAMEAAADAGEILVSPETAALLPTSCRGAFKADGVLLCRAPRGLPPLDVVARDAVDVSRFIPKALRPTLSAGPVQPEHRPATIGFCFVGFDEAVALADLDETFRRIEEILSSYDVTFLATDLAGGGVKIITAAGLPIAQPDAEDRMLRAARDIVEAGLPLPVRFGVQRGHVFAGTVGPPYRMAFTVIGDVVNTAARLVARAGAGEVLTLAPVLEQAATEFAVDELAPFVAKGKAEPLIPLRVGSATGRRTRRDEVLPLVGRDALMAAVDDALDEVRAGRGGVLDLVGDAGMGKSRLADELVTHAADLRIVRAESDPLDAGHAYRVAQSLLRPLVGVATVAHLKKYVRDQAPELAEWLPLLGVAFGFDIKPTGATRRLAPQAVPAKIREVTVAFVAACTDQPTVAVIEDLHWSDAPSARLIQALAAACASAPLLIATTRRPVDGVIAPPGTTLELTELDPSAAGAMLDQLVATPLLPDRRRALIERAGGNPMFLRELAISIAAGTDDELPDRIESLIDERIDRLDPVYRSVLRAAAVVGTDFSADEVEAALGEPVPASAFDRLSGFVIDDLRFRFRHALMRDSAYANVPFRARRVIHARVGSYLEARPDAEEYVERLAVHFAAAKDSARAWKYGAAAGDRARARFAYAEAAAFYDDALRASPPDVEGDERFRVVDSHAYCLQTAGNLGGALEAVRRGQRLVRDNAEQKARLHLQNTTIQIMLGDLDSAERAAKAGMRLAAGVNAASATRVRILAQLSRIRDGRGDYEGARRSAIDAATLARATEDRPGLAHALAAQFIAETSLRTPGREAAGREAHSLFVALGQDADAANVLNFIGIDHERSGRLLDAIEAYTDAEALQQSAGLQLHAAVSAYNRASVLTKQADVERAEPIIERCLSVFAASNYAVGLLAARTLAAQLQSLRGDHAAAISATREISATFRSAGMDENALDADLLTSEFLLQSGDVAAARRAAPRLQGTEESEYRAQVLLLHAVIAATRTRDKRVRALLDEAEQRAIARDLAYVAATVRVIRGRLFADDETEQAGQHALRAMGVLRVPLVELATATPL